ncbi:hypothetical protein, partial [Bosea sp. (in: a-proteobacteria)]|uniref:hypothetical protein n=1 Tax=Bosea sp. (in: a-proteobacteria) TaxID=1871050 RepID=UPI0031FEE710
MWTIERSEIKWTAIMAALHPQARLRYCAACRLIASRPMRPGDRWSIFPAMLEQTSSVTRPSPP